MGHNGHFLKLKTVIEDKRCSLLKLRLEMLTMVTMIKRATGGGRPDMVGVHQDITITIIKTCIISISIMMIRQQGNRRRTARYGWRPSGGE